jgi:3D (Asp-Asp-Asp) domain-containing protein
MILRGVLFFHLALAAAFVWPTSAQVVDAPTPGQDIYLEPETPEVHATVTAYSSSPDETWGDPFITASGRRVFDGLVACPRALPFGTKVIIGDRTYHCYDRLHRKYDDRFDIWMSTKNAALEFGKRQLLVEVVES